MGEQRVAFGQVFQVLACKGCGKMPHLETYTDAYRGVTVFLVDCPVCCTVLLAHVKLMVMNTVQEVAVCEWNEVQRNGDR